MKWNKIVTYKMQDSCNAVSSLLFCVWQSIDWISNRSFLNEKNMRRGIKFQEKRIEMEV